MKQYSILDKINLWLLGGIKSNGFEEVKPKPKINPVITQPYSSVNGRNVEILVRVNLNQSYYKVSEFAFDGWSIPNIDSPYHATNYLNEWLIARNIGDGFNNKPRAFLEACINTKTSSSMYYCGYMLDVKIINATKYGMTDEKS